MTPAFNSANSQSPAGRLRLAQDPATPPADLHALARQPNSRAVKEAVVRNPNTLPADLLHLAGRYWAGFLENPVLPLLLLEDPGLPHRLPLRMLRALVRREGVPPLILQTLARHADREVREAARYHVDFPADSAPAEAPGWEQSLQRELEKLPAQRATLPELLDLGVVPDWLLAAVAGTRNGTLRAAVINQSQRPAASPALREVGSLLRRAFGEWQTVTYQYSWGPSDHQQLAGRAELSEVEVEQLAQGSLAWQIQAARSANLRPATLEQLARSPEWRIGSALARHPHLTPNAALHLLSRGSLPVLRSLAQSCYVPPPLLPRLARTPDAAVRRGVARNRHTDPATLALLAADPDATVRLAVAAHRQLPRAALSQLVADASPEVRIRAAYNPTCDATHYERLLADNDAKVREELASRPGLPAAYIRRLLDDSVEDVRHAAAFNYGTPRHILDFIVDCVMAAPAERPPLPEWGTGKGWHRLGRSEPRLASDDRDLETRLYQDTATAEEQAEAAASPTMRLRRAAAYKTTDASLLTQLAT